AVSMGRLRSALRAHTLEFDHPATVLDRLDRTATHFEPGTLATISYTIIDPTRTHATIALAGHPPPMLAQPGHPTELPTLPVRTPIGFPTPTPCPQTTLHLPPGALLCYYTDGLVERRNSTLDHGLHHLRSILTPEDPETVCVRVMATLIGTQPARDDIALLIIRRDPE
ncbi:MAG TPA: PP2C family protein-serine/threonine phosphatase, partial [Pseudonocardiaceae bacterium]|nr:PP2C family protein-serine/threonine phosphatase [Pseudonocardiaceae bacterium]